MKNTSKTHRTFQLSLVAAALSLAHSAWAVDLTCNTPTGCIYDHGPNSEWLINKAPTAYKNALNITVEAGNYQNKAKTENGADRSLGQPSQLTDFLFSVYDTTAQGNVITLKSGVKATLKEDYASSQLLGVYGTTANLREVLVNNEFDTFF